MIIHVVQSGDTVDSIAAKYGISVTRLIQENELRRPYNLVEGDALVILYPEVTHTVVEGDTLEGIASSYGISIMELLRNNFFLSDREYIYPGEELVIRYQDSKIGSISTNGYAYPFINRDILRKTLPFLTYLTIFNYRINAQGNLNDIDDREVIQIAKEYGVVPIMLISTVSERGGQDIAIEQNILNNEETQENLIKNILSKMESKGYLGLNIDFQYIHPSNRENFVDLVKKITNELNEEGYFVFVTITPSSFEVETGIIYQGIDYKGLGEAANGIVLLSYAWGFSYGLPIGILPFVTVRKLIDYAAAQISNNRITMGIPIIGYVWQLPYVEGQTVANSISQENAVELAAGVGATIQYDNETQTSYFHYVNTYEYMVLFKDARGIDGMLNLMNEYNFHGIATWNIMSFFAQMWLIINSRYNINRLTF
ncbi:LysM peptidoglycan-binding domain-containing protein [Anaerocolumna aminovalerica]|jgi:spore germination protein|uniref:LysM peptidoglycan-binding domain-containing protein n=1 Tax=Anaerocolumna aminovalerica TaxID=1527 RepID=UPI001C0E9184|nr:LysM peptidoglycan-binding domain-containing protein [Anaerocolumna aminovalerica]MBU5333852.1 LysM peptidoglycan-binding domain-containing protein [Anaerocolumna aminovalerica]